MQRERRTRAERIKLLAARVLLALAVALVLSACGDAATPAGGQASDVSVSSGEGHTASQATGHTAPANGQLELTYATQFRAETREDGSTLLAIGPSEGEADRFLLVPEGTADQRSEEGLPVIEIPVHNVYLAASSAMDFFRQLGELDRVSMTSTKANDWSLPEVLQALDKGSMRYVGKYSAPDYELVLSQKPGVAIESTMIYHAPEVAERLASFGIPVVVERSSYEANPLGRLEWIKLYGLLTGRLNEAQAFFDEQCSVVEHAQRSPLPHTPRVAFFSISSGGRVVVRRPGDYVSQMISMAGGEYFLPAEEQSDDTGALSTMNMEMESFFEAAHNADCIVYNSAIEGELASLDELVAKSPRLADFDAVKSGNVWCTSRDFFQQPTCVAQMVSDLHEAFAGAASDRLEYLYRLKWENS